MNYPRVVIDTNIIKNNVKTIVELARTKNIEVAGVTKGFCGEKNIVKAYIDGGVKYLADSRIKNLIKLKDFNLPKIMLRLPMISEIDKVINYVDISLNSEIKTIRLLSEKAIEKNKIHRIILMVDLGDLREGYFSEEELMGDIEEIINLKGVKLIGLGTNLTCYGGVIPTEEKLERLYFLQNEIEDKYKINLEILSGGNSSTIHLLEKDIDLKGINNLRLGESLMIGVETAYGNPIPNTSRKAFILQCEIIEVKEKPSVPIGEIGMDAFGKPPTFVDRGIRKKILCALGKQDIEFDSIFPLDKDLIILGGSSDHLIIDGSDSEVNYQVGDIVEFEMSYGGILRAMTSEYVEKHIIS